MSLRERSFLRQVRHIRPDLGDPRTAAVRAQIVRDFGALVPPFALHLPAPELLAACWAITREPTCGRDVTRATKEAVAAAVSTTNQCPYCVDVHTTMLHALGDRAPAAAIAGGDPESIADAALRALVAWARASRTPQAPILLQRPFPDGHAPELIGIALAYHYINRMVNIFAVESPFPMATARTRPILRRMAVPAFRRLAARRMQPGASLDLLGPAPLPPDLGWAAGDPVIADAFGRAAAAFEAAGQRALPAEVRALVSDRLAVWHGEEPGVSRAWVEDAVRSLPVSQRPVGRLALLAAFASYQVDDRVLEQARSRPGTAGDEGLVATAGWASFAAARRIGLWLDHRTASKSAAASTGAGGRPARPA
jgi:AhpD family alkylhydroperoxidase